MKHVLTVDRFRVWLAIAMLAVIALGSLWILEVMRRNADEGSERSAARNEPDYFVEKFSFIRLSNTGHANYHVTGARLSHLPRSDNIEIQSPQINSYAENQSPLFIHAGKAVIEQKSAVVFPARDHDQVHLYDQVSVERPQAPQADRLKLETEYLLLLPDQDLMKTDRALTLSGANIDITAVGMEANNATHQIQLLSQAKGVFRHLNQHSQPRH